MQTLFTVNSQNVQAPEHSCLGLSQLVPRLPCHRHSPLLSQLNSIASRLASCPFLSNSYISPCDRWIKACLLPSVHLSQSSSFFKKISKINLIFPQTFFCLTVLKRSFPSPNFWNTLWLSIFNLAINPVTPGAFIVLSKLLYILYSFSLLNFLILFLT